MRTRLSFSYCRDGENGLPFKPKAEFLINARATSRSANLAKILGLTGKPEGIDGSRVEEMILAGQIEEVARYCCSSNRAKPTLPVRATS